MCVWERQGGRGEERGGKGWEREKRGRQGEVGRKRQGGRGEKRWGRRGERQEVELRLQRYMYMSCENGDTNIHFGSYGYRHKQTNKQTTVVFSLCQTDLVWLYHVSTTTMKEKM